MYKILHVIDSGGLYGAEVVLLNLAREQKASGMHPVIASIGEHGIVDKPLEIAARKNGLPVKTFRMRPGFNVPGIRDVLSYCNTGDFHVMHSHGYKGNILFGFLPRRIRRVPVVTTLHGWTSTDRLTKMRIYEWLDARSLRFLDAVVAVNRNMLQHPRIPKLPAEKLFVIDNGIPEEAGESVVLDADIADFCRQGFILGSIGRFSREKGFDVLIESLHIIRSGGLDAKLLLIGDGPLRSELVRIAESLGVLEYVFFAGYRENASVYMKKIDIYVISSFTEGLPITLLEAMRAKISVVATAVGGIPDVLSGERCGFLVNPGDPGQIASAVRCIIDDPAMAADKIESAYKKFKDSYSVEGMALSYRDVYRHVCCQSSG